MKSKILIVSARYYKDFSKSLELYAISILKLKKAKYKIRANLINPGFIKTSYYEKFKMRKKLYNWTLSRIPQKRWGEPEEISALISFLISDASNYITGETINIDGGWTNS